ncbi:MAG: hypothetical protein LBR51_02205 [Bacteroidales bacterium]|jgi:hypothetical protein|nr:hypothetical protein [Bacteroidales bacterium]
MKNLYSAVIPFDNGKMGIKYAIENFVGFDKISKIILCSQNDTAVNNSENPIIVIERNNKDEIMELLGKIKNETGNIPVEELTQEPTVIVLERQTGSFITVEDDGKFINY